MDSKPRILYLLKILQEQTDEEHPLTTNQLIEILSKEYDISAHRVTIAKDIATLQDYGVDIVVVHSTQCKYFVGNRIFELPELKLLIDAVESSKFVTSKKSEALIEKIYSLTSKGLVSKLKRHNYIADRIKPDNEQIYYIVNAINDAINGNSKISFQYYEYNELKEKKLKNDGEVYILSPYGLLWSGDYYYVLGYSDKKDKIVTFRVDRIVNTPEILNEVAAPKPAEFEISDFTKEVFNMFDGKDVEVEIIVDNSLMKTMIDRFGEEVKTEVYNDSSFKLTTEVSVSSTFFGWVFGFDGKIKINAPSSVKEQYEAMISRAK